MNDFKSREIEISKLRINYNNYKIFTKEELEQIDSNIKITIDKKDYRNNTRIRNKKMANSFFVWSEVIERCIRLDPENKVIYSITILDPSSEIWSDSWKNNYFLIKNAINEIFTKIEKVDVAIVSSEIHRIPYHTKTPEYKMESRIEKHLKWQAKEAKNYMRLRKIQNPNFFFSFNHKSDYRAISFNSVKKVFKDLKNYEEVTDADIINYAAIEEFFTKEFIMRNVIEKPTESKKNVRTFTYKNVSKETYEKIRDYTISEFRERFNIDPLIKVNQPPTSNETDVFLKKAEFNNQKDLFEENEDEDYVNGIALFKRPHFHLAVVSSKQSYFSILKLFEGAFWYPFDIKIKLITTPARVKNVNYNLKSDIFSLFTYIIKEYNIETKEKVFSEIIKTNKFSIYINSLSDIYFEEVIENINKILKNSLKCNILASNPVLEGLPDNLPITHRWEEYFNFYLEKTGNKVIREVNDALCSAPIKRMVILSSLTPYFSKKVICSSESMLNNIKYFYSNNKKVLDFITKYENWFPKMLNVGFNLKKDSYIIEQKMTAFNDSFYWYFNKNTLRLTPYSYDEINNILTKAYGHIKANQIISLISLNHGWKQIEAAKSKPDYLSEFWKFIWNPHISYNKNIMRALRLLIQIGSSINTGWENLQNNGIYIHGKPGTGKTWFFKNLLNKLVGEQQVSTWDMDSSFGLEDIHNKRAILIDDIDNALSVANKGILKRLMSGNRFFLNRKFEKHLFIETKNCLIVITSNFPMKEIFRNDPALTEKRFSLSLEMFTPCSSLQPNAPISFNREKLNDEIYDFINLSIELHTLLTRYEATQTEYSALNSEIPACIKEKLYKIFPKIEPMTIDNNFQIKQINNK